MTTIWSIGQNSNTNIKKNKVTKLTLKPSPKFMTYNFHQNGTCSRDYFKKTRGNYKPCIQTLHIHILCPFLQPKKIHITCHTRNCHYDAQNSDNDHNTHSKISQNPIVRIKTMWHWIGKNHARNLTKMHKNIHIKRKNWHTHFLSILICKIITKQSRMHQETHGNFLRIFTRNLTCTGVRIAKTWVQLARNSKNWEEKRQRPKECWSNPALVDPDLQNVSETLNWSGSTELASKGHRWRKMGRFWTDPIRRLYKRLMVRILAFFRAFLSLLLLFLAVLSSPSQTLTLKIPIPTRNGLF